MKSIRVSLIVYFLVLLAVAVGAASLLVYRNAAENLQAKLLADRKLLDQEHKEDRARIFRTFDNELERLAQDVARLAAAGAAARSQPDRFVRYLALGQMSEAQAHAFAPLWLAEAVAPFSPGLPFSQWTLAGHVAWIFSQDVAIDEDDLPHAGDPSDRFYYQINSSW